MLTPRLLTYLPLYCFAGGKESVFDFMDKAKGAELSRFFPMSKVIDLPRGEGLIIIQKSLKAAA